jgi:hypothetical protein
MDFSIAPPIEIADLTLLSIESGGNLVNGAFLVAGAAIGALATIFAEWRQSKRNRENDARSLRDARRARLEIACIPILSSSRAMLDLILRQGRRAEEVTSSVERVELQRLWSRANQDNDEALARLAVDAPDTSETIVKAYSDIRSAFFAFIALKETPPVENIGLNIEKEINECRQVARNALLQLQESIRSHFERLDKPFP